MNEQTKEVYFDQYCKNCEYFDKKENEDLCCECLNSPYNYNSHKPVRFSSTYSK